MRYLTYILYYNQKQDKKISKYNNQTKETIDLISSGADSEDSSSIDTGLIVLSRRSVEKCN